MRDICITLRRSRIRGTLPLLDLNIEKYWAGGGSQLERDVAATDSADIIYLNRSV